MSRILVCLAFLPLSFGQSLPHRGEYALVLQDAPVARNTHSRAEWIGPAAQARLQAVRKAQAPVLAELQRRSVPVTYASQLLVNAVFVRTDSRTAAQLSKLPGVLRVQYLPPVTRDLNTALGLENVSAAWSAVGGASNAGAGVKIGIIDTGIDQGHPGFQSSTPLPAGFPKGDSNYTNNKVIVARSYVSLIAQQYDSPDDLTPRDRIGHGTATAMIAAGVQNTGPAAPIQGMAPGAFLGNYKIFGSPGVNDFTLVSAMVQALTDAASDGMDIVTLAINEGDPALSGPLDFDSSNCGGNCDVRAQAVETAVANGLTVVTSAGNSNGSGVQPVTLGSVHTPGTAPSGITVGATTNAHLLFQAVHLTVTGAPANLQNIHALFGDGPHIGSPLTARVVDVTTLGNDGLACAALPAGSLNGSIALVQRGTCAFSVKINNAQSAGAVGAIIYQSSGIDTIYSSWGAQDTGIPAVMIGNTDGAALKSYVDANTSATVALDPAITQSPATQNQVASFSSRGPAIGTFSSPAVCPAGAQCPVLALKPELVAVGAGIYTAAQKIDPNGDTYNASGYTGVSGTSFAVPMVAGALAIVKQQHPGLSPAQLKSTVVNTATQDVADVDGSQARVNAVGAGKLSVADAISAAATLEPATMGFGVISQSALPVRLALKITNITSASATFNIAVQSRDTTSAATLSVSPASVTVPPGQFSTLTVALQGSQPAPGSYEGFLVVTGAGPTLRVPYEYQVLASPQVPYDLFPVINSSFLAGAGDSESNNAAPFVAFRLVDKIGAPIINTPVSFNVVQGSATLGTSSDAHTFNYGVAGTDLNVGNQPGDLLVTGSAGGLSYTFNGFVRQYPTISNGGVVDAATGKVGQGLAPGSYISIYGTALADATETYSTPELPVSLSYGSISFDGGGLSLPGHIHFVSPGQINVQVPWEFQGQTSVQMTVWSNYLPSAKYTVPLAAASPGFFPYAGNAAAVDFQAGAIVTNSSPAKRGDTVELFVNGLGPVTPTPTSGSPAPTNAILNTTTLPTVTLGGVNLPVGFSGLAPGFIGLYQVNVTIPANAPTGNQPLVITMNGISSPPANLPVQ